MRRWVWPLLLALAVAGCTYAGTAAPAGQGDRAAHPAAAAPAGQGDGAAQLAATAPDEPGLIPADWLASLEQVATVHLHLGLPVPKEKVPQPLYATHPLHRITIAHLLDLLSQSRLAPDDGSMPARSASLQWALKKGGSLAVRPAHDCTPVAGEAKPGYICRQVPGELILHSAQGREVRISNPALAAWISAGWEADIPVGTLPDMEKELALAMARQADPKATWRATFFAEYPVEGKGGTEIHRAWMVEAEYPSGSKTRMVIDAQTGQIIRLGQLEALE